MADDIKVVADYTDLQLMRRELVGVAKDAKASASVFEREFNKVERQLARQKKEFDANVKASQNFYNQLLGVNKSTKDAASSAAIFERELKKVEAATNRATVAQQRFENTSRKGMRGFEVIAQQAGYQIGDLAVQIQGGTNAAVAFGQQGSQLLGFFGPAGAIAGAALAIGTGLIAPFLKGEKAAKELTDRIKELKVEIADIKGEQTLPEEQLKLLSDQEDLTENLLLLEGELITAKAKVAALDKAKLTEGVQYQNALGEVARIEGEIQADEEQRVKNSELLLKYGSALVEKRKALADQEERTLRQEVSISRIKLQFGEESEAVKLLEKQHALENYELELKRLGLHPTMIANLVEMKSVAIDNAMALSQANDKSKALADSLKEAASAMASLSGFTAGLDKALAVSVAKVNALKAGADAAIAGTIAGQEIDLRTKTMAALKSGGNRQQIMQEYLQGRQTIGQFKKSEEERKKLEADAREAAKTGGGKSPAKQLEEYMTQQEKAVQIDRTRMMLGKEDARIQELLNKYKEAGVAVDMKRIEQLAKEEERLRLLTSAHTYLENALMSVVDGTQSVGNAFKAMIRDMILDLYREKVAKNFASTVLGFFGFANGGVFNGGNVTAFANGGVVGSPTYFPMAGGKAGLMGEAGPEAIMPLKRGANGKLGVEMHGGGSVVVNQTINVSTGVQQTVRAEIKSLMPQIAEQSKAAVLDAKRRGGSYGGKF